MLSPQVADEALFVKMNLIKAEGKMLDTASLEGKRAYKALERDIDKIRNASVSTYHCLKSVLGALSGDGQSVRDSVRILKSIHGGDLECYLNAVKSLGVVGLYTESYDALMSKRAEAFLPDCATDKISAACNCFAVGYLRDYLREIERMNVVGFPDGFIQAAKRFAAAAEIGIDEVAARRMMDAAGEAFSRHSQLVIGVGCTIVDDAVVIEVSGNFDSDMAAAIEWDYAGILLDTFENAPIDRISINVSSSKYKGVRAELLPAVRND